MTDQNVAQYQRTTDLGATWLSAPLSRALGVATEVSVPDVACNQRPAPITMMTTHVLTHDVAAGALFVTTLEDGSTIFPAPWSVQISNPGRTVARVPGSARVMSTLMTQRTSSVTVVTWLEVDPSDPQRNDLYLRESVDEGRTWDPAIWLTNAPAAAWLADSVIPSVAQGCTAVTWLDAGNREVLHRSRWSPRMYGAVSGAGAVSMIFDRVASGRMTRIGVDHNRPDESFVVAFDTARGSTPVPCGTMLLTSNAFLTFRFGLPLFEVAVPPGLTGVDLHVQALRVFQASCQLGYSRGHTITLL